MRLELWLKMVKRKIYVLCGHLLSKLSSLRKIVELFLSNFSVLLCQVYYLFPCSSSHPKINK